jgi:hypothetical protein
MAPCSSIVLKPFPRPYPKPRLRLPERKYVTVCIAALAANSQAVVCVADKALSYGSYIQWDSDSSKMLRINPSGSLIMFSGSDPSLSEILSRLIADADKFTQNKISTKSLIETHSKETIDFLIDRHFLVPRQLTRQEYITAASGQQINSYIKEIAGEIDNWSFDASLIFCGIDQNIPFILHMHKQAIASDVTGTGFQAIGAGWEQATARLLFSDHTRDHPIDRVLYDVFDAKANAELAPSVGYEWDAWILVHSGIYEVPKQVKELIESVWSKYQRSPFEKYDSKIHTKGPKADWRRDLSDYAETFVSPKPPKVE